ncbi:uncharacterized protein LOC121733191 [Aricia agestis]|uniref:uncharacterized protein LOC121733191 n=1 Tax=Aricia agestis TaxID=91739 RepID=UPI001C20518B|nr:uncharacterized protein LOC121733191 [Aricia agestis]
MGGNEEKLQCDQNTSKYDVTAWGYRHQQCLLLFCCFTTAFSMRACMGVALVGMVDSAYPVASLVQNSTDSVKVTNATDGGILHAMLLVPPYPQFQWDKKTQDIILSSFFWGYMLLQIPAGQLNHMFGPRFMLTMALMLNGITALLLPWAAYYGGWIAAALMRFVQGLGQSCIFPGMHCLFGKWTPLEERGRLAGCAYGGQALGLVVGLPISGYIAASPLGWPGVFRFYGILCCVAAGILWWICADSPAKHTSISELERMYIEKNLGQSRFKKVPPVPWCRILRSRGLYAIMIAHIGQNFSHVTIYSEIPSFMDKIMHVNIKANGLLTALPFLCMFFANFFFSWLTDILIVKKIMSVTNTRKLANSIGSVPVALGLVALALSPKDIYIVEPLLIAICSLKVASHLGFQLNHIDMSSNYSGTLMSITNFISNLCASLAPITAGLILQDVTSEQQWCTVFYVSAAFLFFSNLGYVMLGTSEKQDWDNPQEPKKGDINKFSGWGYRHQQCFILFCCLTTAYSMRACMGVSLVAMADRGPILKTSNFTENVTNIRIELNNTMPANQILDGGIMHSLLLTPPYPKFQWSKKTQDMILSSFFWGYMLLQIPSGQLAYFFGARYMLTGALAINAVVSFSLPWAAQYGGWILTIIFRIVQGLSQACILPGMHTMLGKWTHLEERSRLAGLAYGGQALGTVLGLPISGFLAASSLGWPGVFRFYGILSGIVAGILWYFGADTPAKHTKISLEEKAYIENNAGSGGGKRPPVPWSKILRSRGMYAIMIAHIGQTWGQLTLYAEVPAYMDKVMGVDIKANGLLTALPFMVMWFTNFFFSWFTDRLIVKKTLSVTNARKLANSLGCIPAAVGLVVLGYAPKNIYIVESILVVVCGFKVASHVGFHLSHIDISNNYSGTMMSISNFVSNSVGSLAPIVAGFVLTDVTSAYHWRRVFFISAAIYFVTNAVYVLLGTSERAEWDKIEDKVEDKDAEDPEEKQKMIKK